MDPNDPRVFLTAANRNKDPRDRADEMARELRHLGDIEGAELWQDPDWLETLPPRTWRAAG